MSMNMKLYVITQSTGVFQQIYNEMFCEGWDIIQVSHIDYLPSLDEQVTACVLVEVANNAVQELKMISDIRNRHRCMQVIAFGKQWQVANVVQAIKIGAFEVCEYPNNEHTLKDAIHRAMKFERQESRELHDLIPRTILERLTIGEAKILRLLVEGRTTKEVGASLDVSVRTIHYRKKSILQKLGVQNRSEAIELIRLTRGSLATF